METARINTIAAIGENRELGKDNELIWKLDADFARMKELIHGHTLIMGRVTYESIGRELPSCSSIVITNNKEYMPPYKNVQRTTVVYSLDEALKKAQEVEANCDSERKEIFIFGGAKVYEDALPFTDRLYLTKIEASDSDADSFFPEYPEFTNVIEKTECEENGITFQLLTLER